MERKVTSVEKCRTKLPKNNLKTIIKCFRKSQPWKRYFLQLPKFAVSRSQSNYWKERISSKYFSKKTYKNAIREQKYRVHPTFLCKLISDKTDSLACFLTPLNTWQLHQCFVFKIWRFPLNTFIRYLKISSIVDNWFNNIKKNFVESFLYWQSIMEHSFLLHPQYLQTINLPPTRTTSKSPLTLGISTTTLACTPSLILNDN